MKFYICVVGNDVKAIGTTPVSMDGCVSHEIDTDVEIDFEKIGGYDYVDDQLIFNDEKWKNVENEYLIGELQSRRETECFSVINRGEAWYSMVVNTDERKEELNNWYREWLDVTETLVVPDKPDWID